MISKISKVSSLALLLSFSLHAAENSVEEYVGKVSNIYVGKSDVVKIGVVEEEDKYLECASGNWPLFFQQGNNYSDSWLDLLILANRGQSTIRIGYQPDSESNCAIEYLALVQGDGISAVDDNGSSSLLRTGEYGNIALIGTNGLTQDSYSASENYGNDIAAAAFDGHTYSEQVNDDAEESIARGLWLAKKDPDNRDKPFWLQVDFGGLVNISGYRTLVNEQSTDLGRGPKKILVQISTDGEEFIDHETHQLSKAPEQLANLTEKVLAQYVRIVVQSNHGDSFIEIDELEIFAD